MEYVTIPDPTIGIKKFPIIKSENWPTEKRRVISKNTKPSLYALANPRYLSWRETTEDVTGREITTSVDGKKYIFSIPKDHPIVHMIDNVTNKIKTDYPDQFMQLFFLTRMVMMQDVSSLHSGNYNPEVDNQIRTILLYRSLQGNEPQNTVLKRGMVAVGGVDTYQPWIDKTVSGIPLRIDLFHLPIDKTTGRPVNITTFENTQQGYLDYMQKTNGFPNILEAPDPHALNVSVVSD